MTWALVITVWLSSGPVDTVLYDKPYPTSYACHQSAEYAIAEVIDDYELKGDDRVLDVSHRCATVYRRLG